MDRRWIGSWLGGPRSAGVTSPEALGYPGQRLGLPEGGSGSVAGFGRRLGAVTVDWLACVLIARGVLDVGRSGGGAFAVPAVFALEYLVLLSTVGSTLGMRIFGVRVARLDGGLPGLRAVAVRTALLVLAVPALVWDRDQRGLHDKAAGTVALRR